MWCKPEDIRIDWVEDRPITGMWTCGPNNGWLIATHLPTQTQIRLYGSNMHRTRQDAMDLLEMATERMRDETAWFPENLQRVQGAMSRKGHHIGPDETEHVARAIVSGIGLAPDAIVDGVPQWRQYIRDARCAIEALDQLRHRQADQSLTVTLYTAPGSEGCRATREALRFHGIRFNEIDMAADEGIARYVSEALGYGAAPVVVVAPDHHWGGEHRPDLIEGLARQLAGKNIGGRDDTRD